LTSKSGTNDKFIRDVSLRRDKNDKYDKDDYHSSSLRGTTTIRRTSIDDDLYKYQARSNPPTRLKPIESRGDSDRYTSMLSSQKKLKALEEDDGYSGYSGGGRSTTLQRNQLAPISSIRGRKDDSDRDSDDDYRPGTRGGNRSTTRTVTPPPLTLAKYGSLDGLSGRRGSALIPIG